MQPSVRIRKKRVASRKPALAAGNGTRLPGDAENKRARQPSQGLSTNLAEVCALLNEHGAKYVVVGASALQRWGSTRATRDVDILIEPTAKNAERVLEALTHLTGGLARDLFAEEVARKPVTIIGDLPRVDILTVAWGSPRRPLTT